MGETPEGDAPEWRSSMDAIIDSLSAVSDGHKDENGNLRPELVQQEIRNQLSKIGIQLYLFDLKGEEEARKELSVRSAKRLIELYPDQREFMAGVSEEAAHTAGMADLFAKESENEDENP